MTKIIERSIQTTCTSVQTMTTNLKVSIQQHTTRLSLGRITSLQCYCVLSDMWLKIELCIPLESESSVLSTCNAFVFLSPPSKLKFAVRFCSICKELISFSAILF